MKSTSGDGQNESAEAWPRGLKIVNDEFEQCLGVAQLARKLWENKIARIKAPLERDKAEGEGPEKFLTEAWRLIEKAREHVLREADPRRVFDGARRKP